MEETGRSGSELWETASSVESSWDADVVGQVRLRVSSPREKHRCDRQYEVRYRIKWLLF